MSQKKSTISENNQDKTVLDNILWFIENYLPQKKKKSSHSEFHLDKLFTIKKKLASKHFQLLGKDLKITFTFGNWALPYLKFLKRIKFFR